ncbi:hypothetical protein ABPG74_004416 [Tetrahymena malaccensis]
MLVYQEEQQKNQKEENIKESQDYEEAQKKITQLQSQLEDSIKEKNQLSEHNINLSQEFEHLKNQNLQNLKDKQNELMVIGEKYEKEIQSLKKEMNDRILQTNQENLKKIDIFVKENIRLEDQLQKFESLSKEQLKQIQIKDIQIESLKNELKQAKELLELEIKKQQQTQVVKPDSIQTNPKIQSQQNTKRSQIQLEDINSQSYQTLVTKRDENDKENIRINQIITPQVPSKNIYEQDKALKNLLAKINDFIEQKDTKESSDVINREDNHFNENNLNESQQSIHKSSLNNHYNKKLRILRVNNHNTSLNTSYTQPTDNHRRGQSLTNQSLNDSCQGVGFNQHQTHLRNFSIERDSNIRNPYLLDAADSHRSQFFPHSRSNSNLNTQRKAISTHLNTAQMGYQQKPYDREQFQYNNYAHNRSFFSESDTSKGNLDFLQINQNIGNNYLSSKESPLRIDEEYNSIQQKKQQQQIQSQISQDLSIITRAPYNENYSSCLNEYNYMSNKLQDKIEIKLSNQQQVYKLQEKENQPLFANNYNQFAATSLNYDQNQVDLKQERKKFQSTQEIQQKLQLWDNMDTLAVEDEEQNGFMNTIKDLHSKIRLIKK